MLQTGAQVANDAVQGVLQRIDALAAKLGTTAAGVWDIYLAQAKVEAIRDTVLGSVAGLLFIACSVGFSLTDDDDAKAWTFFVGMILLVFSGYFFYGAIGEWINPSYWAFQHLTEDLKKLF